MKKLMLALSISLMFAPAAYAAGADAKPANNLPPFGQEKTIPAPTIAKKVLSNGLEVWVVPRKGLPRVDYVLAVRDSGLAADPKSHPGFAKLLAGLLNEGSTKRDSRAIAELAQSYGGSVAASPGNDGITVFANAVTSNAGPMMNLLAEVARMPAFPAKEVELAKANALQGLRVSETTPRFRAERAISKAIYGEHPYGNTTETAESITSTTEELLRTEHARRFRPERSLLVITGRISQADAMKFAQAAFGDWKGQGEAAPAIAAFTPSAKPARILLQRDGSVQSTLRLGAAGIPATSPDYVPLRLASTILGGGFSSRVNTNLREEKGYTYGASAGARTMRNGGGIVGGADVRNEVTGAALTEYFGEYRRLGKLHRVSLRDAAGDDQQAALGTEALGMLGAQQFFSGAGDRLGGLGGVPVWVIAVDRLADRAFCAEARRGLRHTQPLQRVGLGQLDFLGRERRHPRHFGQQVHHRAGARRDRIGEHGDAIVARAGGNRTAVTLRQFGNRARVAFGAAFIEQAREQLGKSRMALGVRSQAGITHRQHVVNARQALARDDPHFEPV